MSPIHRQDWLAINLVASTRSNALRLLQFQLSVGQTVSDPLNAERLNVQGFNAIYVRDISYEQVRAVRIRDYEERYGRHFGDLSDPEFNEQVDAVAEALLARVRSATKPGE